MPVTARLPFVALTLLAVAYPARAEPDAIDKKFLEVAPEIIKRAKERKYANVGVLKFQVRKGDGAPDDGAGELNMSLANRLEAALAESLPDDTLGILWRPSLKAQENPFANHAKPEGRRPLFGVKYPLAWGNTDALPGAFVIGRVDISKDLRTLTLALEMFGRDGKVEPIGKPIELPATRRTLVEAGYSYVMARPVAEKLSDGARGARKNVGQVVELKAEDEEVSFSEVVVFNNSKPAEGVRPTAADALDASPVKLTFLVNNAPVRVEGDQVPEPGETDVVTFRLENTDKTATYAVVLKVNGKNTLFEEEMEAARCRKWILGPGTSLEVKGFQNDDRKSIPFRILSEKESAANLVRYKDLGGTVRMIAFRGEQVAEDPSIEEKKYLNDQLVSLTAVSYGARGLAKGEEKPGSLAALKKDLRGRAAATEGMRGVIDKGNRTEDNPIQHVYFKTLPTVGVSDITIRYYSPKK
ncbi:MAG TPA: hypothetical protein VKE40_03055 [Gemmataceae bacterium]|nr:hypothetical protein [Gemmataceae bacterium]